jgi:hypothetical protein
MITGRIAMAGLDGKQVIADLAEFLVNVSCPLWVINGPDDPEIWLPFFPRKQTQVGPCGRASRGWSQQVGADRLRGLLPRDIFISVEQRTPGNLDPDEWAILRRVIDLIQANAKGAELGPVLETIENALRADHARLIEAEWVGPPGANQRRPLPAALVHATASAADSL